MVLAPIMPPATATSAWEARKPPKVFAGFRRVCRDPAGTRNYHFRLAVRRPEHSSVARVGLASSAVPLVPDQPTLLPVWLLGPHRGNPRVLWDKAGIWTARSLVLRDPTVRVCRGVAAWSRSGVTSLCPLAFALAFGLSPRTSGAVAGYEDIASQVGLSIPITLGNATESNYILETAGTSWRTSTFTLETNRRLAYSIRFQRLQRSFRRAEQKRFLASHSMPPDCHARTISRKAR